ncbi:tautomerase family protein [Thermoactinospora rubra]|uniref:tautomerase family protein n=1 Tax=Thermoactinospora rubra TaxID=1088767 RepID=UPI000A10C1BC|nr:N-acetylmuramic acid 6-phosphate etherase [Thermoactinospora rubra]
MPQLFIEAPTGIQPDAKRQMMREITDAVDAAFRIPDVRIWLREYPADNVAQDGRPAAEPVRPVCFLEVPELKDLDTKREMSARIHAAIATAYAGIANTEETLVLMNHYPLENAGWAGRLQSDNPEIVAAVEHLTRD